jgi:hypothetical protein
MAEILQVIPSACKVSEIALDSGRLAIVPSHVGLRGPMLEYSVVMAPERPVTLDVSAVATAQASSAWRFASVLVSHKGGGEGASYGSVRVSVAHLVVADVSALYCAGNGRLWHRPQEATRAIQACNQNHRTGGEFQTDFGETAVAIRLGRGPLRAQARLMGDRLELRVLPPTEE